MGFRASLGQRFFQGLGSPGWRVEVKLHKPRVSVYITLKKNMCRCNVYVYTHKYVSDMYI